MNVIPLFWRGVGWGLSDDATCWELNIGIKGKKGLTSTYLEQSEHFCFTTISLVKCMQWVLAGGTEESDSGWKTKKNWLAWDSTIDIVIRQWIQRHGIGLSSVSRTKIPKGYCPQSKFKGYRSNTICCGQRNVVTDAKVSEQYIEYQSLMLLETPSQPSRVCCQFIVGWVLSDKDIINWNACDEY